jgi:hypothetical protein
VSIAAWQEIRVRSGRDDNSVAGSVGKNWQPDPVTFAARLGHWLLRCVLQDFEFCRGEHAVVLYIGFVETRQHEVFKFC